MVAVLELSLLLVGYCSCMQFTVITLYLSNMHFHRHITIINVFSLLYCSKGTEYIYLPLVSHLREIRVLLAMLRRK